MSGGEMRWRWNEWRRNVRRWKEVAVKRGGGEKSGGEKSGGEMMAVKRWRWKEVDPLKMTKIAKMYLKIAKILEIQWKNAKIEENCKIYAWKCLENMIFTLKMLEKCIMSSKPPP